MQSTTLKKSTETLYEIKAPLATFDTIDLDDFDNGHSNSTFSLKVQSAEKCAIELFETLQKENSDVNKNAKTEEGDELTDSYPGTEHGVGSVIATPTEISCKHDFTTGETEQTDQLEKFSFRDVTNTDLATERDLTLDSRNDSENDDESYDMTDSGNLTPVEANTVSKDANSSENNASAEEIQTKLKAKGRKYKEKSSNVKYQQIDSLSDLSDLEKESPLPNHKPKSDPKDIDIFNDSSDSDSEYVCKGYISTGRGVIQSGTETTDNYKLFNIIGDFVDSDSTPYSSPKPRRPTLPPPLSKEESAIQSKRKAYEKRLQRLQVTTNPIERPRSTTPINIYGLDEYVHISSPEKSPGHSASLQKLKITLPIEEGSKGKSPKRSGKILNQASTDSGEFHSFSFNEDLLFTHTKSAILLEDDLYKGYSPKRVLVPPTLSPKISPRHVPCKIKQVESSMRYICNPWESDSKEQKETQVTSDDAGGAVTDSENWAIFDDFIPQHSQETCDNSQIDTNDSTFTSSGGNKLENTNLFERSYKTTGPSLPREEILTVHIEDKAESGQCEIMIDQTEVDRPVSFHDDIKLATYSQTETVTSPGTVCHDNQVETENSERGNKDEDIGTAV